MSTSREDLVLSLTDAGRLSPDEKGRLLNALSFQTETVATMIVRLGLMAAEDARVAIADVLGYSTAPAEQPDPDVANLLPAEYCRRVGLVPVCMKGEALVVAMKDPSDFFVCNAARLYCQRQLIPQAVDTKTFEEVFEQVFGIAIDTQDVVSQPDDPETLSDHDVERLEDLARDAPIIHCVENLVREALARSASDIHLTVTKQGLKVRYRVDGSLQDAATLAPDTGRGAVLRLKVLAGLDITERRIPQDGRIRLQIAGIEADIRISTMPQAEGEGAVLRFLRNSSDQLNLETLGFPAPMLKTLRSLIQSPDGLILVCGPTGSGKTTTLYAALREIARPEINISTIENPVEQKIDGIAQVEINPAIGFDFPKALRAMLRQDPDVILVGEIRDRETAETANRAALTGHLVLSTIHTDSAVTAIPRLLDMGIEDFLLASTLKAVLSQRLVRRICTSCRVAVELTEADRQAAAAWSGLMDTGQIPTKTYAGTGCPACRQTGYQGRVAISELLQISVDVREQILGDANTQKIAQIAEQSGMKPMAQEALVLCSKGLISLPDAMRIIPPVEAVQS